MANKKISALTALTAAAVDDVAAVVDTSATETKKMLLSDMMILNDTDASHRLKLVWNENDTVDRTLNLLISGASRSLTISGDSSINQNVSTAGTPTFAGVISPTVQTADNAASFYTNIPISGTDAILHTSSHMIGGNSYIYAQATGDGAGSVGPNTIGIGVTGNADIIHIGDANALVDITDAHWSITEAGVGTFVTLYGTTIDTNVAAAGVTLSGVTLQADGTDANIDILVLPKGTGVISVTGTTNYETNVTDDDDIPNKKYVDDAVGTENLWDRVVTTLSPHTANDSVDLGSGAFAGGGITLKSANPTISFKDSSCTDDDVNATIDAQATDTGSGTEDIDVAFKSMVGGTLFTFLNFDADGVLALGYNGQAIQSNPDGDVASDFGRCSFGYNSAVGSDVATWSHFDNKASATDFALLQTSPGLTVLNGSAAAGLALRVANDNKVLIDTAGVASFLGSIKVDTINEYTSTNGVTIDSLKIKDAGFALGSDADGDIYYRNSGALARLAKGTANQVLSMDGTGTTLTWATVAAGGSLDAAYNIGSSIDCDTDPVTITVSDTDNNRALDLVQNDTTNNPDVLQITNAGTGRGLFLDQNGNGKGLQIDSEATTAGNYGLEILTGAGATGAYIQAEASDYCLLGQKNNANGSYYFYRNLAAAATSGAMINILQDHASDDQPALNIQQDGTGYGINITVAQQRGIKVTNASAQPAIDIDQNGDGSGLYINGSGISTATKPAAQIISDFNLTAFQTVNSITYAYTILSQANNQSTGTNYFFRNLDASETSGPVLNIVQDHATDDQPALRIQQDSTADMISAGADLDKVGTWGRGKLGYNGTNSDAFCIAHYDNMAETTYAFYTDGSRITLINGDAVQIRISNQPIAKATSTGWEPGANDTYYLGKNDDDTPNAWKGVILKDTTNGKYYRVEVINGAITATDLTD